MKIERGLGRVRMFRIRCCEVGDEMRRLVVSHLDAMRDEWDSVGGFIITDIETGKAVEHGSYVMPPKGKSPGGDNAEHCVIFKVLKYRYLGGRA